MTLHRHRTLWSLVGTVALSSVVQCVLQRPLHAQEADSATEMAAARALAVEGLKLAQAGRCDEAVSKLERAEKLHHSPIVLSQLGECNVSLGKLVVGTEALRKVLRDPLPDNPSPALIKAYERAQRALEVAKPRIGAITILLSKTAPPDLRLTVDGQVVPATLLDTELPADPGEHTVEVVAVGYLKAIARVSLSPADKKTVSLKLEVDPYAPAIAPPADKTEVAPVARKREPATGTASPRASQAAPSHAAAYVAWGIGVAGVGVGSAFGVIAMKDQQDLEKRCGSSSCTADSSGLLESAKRSGNISTLAFGVGGVGLVMGTVLYFTVGGSSQETGTLAPARSFAGLSRGRAMIGPGSVQLAADF